ncbi:MAG TPA: urease accessory UreF family protein [Gammaproteobacteria bacterium]|nr:urease accessory UreF family protein [Gammaproteobacteria bacterium]
MDARALKLWQLISPTLPVGAYSYSQALEYVIESGDVRGEAGALAWIAGVLEQGIAAADLPILLRVHRARGAGDVDAVRRWSTVLGALRETSELRLEDLAMGGALAQLVEALGTPALPRPLPFASAFAIACADWSIAGDDACTGYAWAWCEAQVAAAVKLVPLGHTSGQRSLLALGERIPRVVERSLAVGDDDIGLSLPGLAIASARHETQYTRLFRS